MSLLIIEIFITFQEYEVYAPLYANTVNPLFDLKHLFYQKTYKLNINLDVTCRKCDLYVDFSASLLCNSAAQLFSLSWVRPLSKNDSL